MLLVDAVCHINGCIIAHAGISTYLFQNYSTQAPQRSMDESTCSINICEIGSRELGQLNKKNNR